MNAPSPRYQPPRPASVGQMGFTLIEVCLALGIIAFAVLPLVGLLSVGLDGYRNAAMRARATQVLNQLADALREAVPAANTNTGVAVGTYVALAPLPQAPNAGAITWTPAANPTSSPFTVYFDENGTFISGSNSISSTAPAPPPPANARLAAGIVLTAPTTSYSPGIAQITVGWAATPASGPFYGTPGNATSQCLYYGTVQGHVENTIELPAIPAAQ